MADAGSRTGFRLRLARRFRASRERVYRAWTEAEALKRWYAPGDSHVALADVDLRVGGGFRVHMAGKEGEEYRLSGTYREIQPPERLVFTWHWDQDPADHVMVVTVEFLEHGQETEVVLTHEGFRSEGEQSGHEAGWQALFEKLAANL